VLRLQPNISSADDDAERDLDAIYKEHAARVAGWAARLGGPSLEAEDIVHEVFLVVYKQLPGFRGDAKITTWLYRITANVVRDRRRRERRYFLRRFLGGRQQHPGPVATPIEVMERQHSTRIVYQGLDQLKENYRTVLILFELEGLAGEEIAELLGVNLKTIWVWSHRARAELRKWLLKHHPAELGFTPLRKVPP